MRKSIFAILGCLAVSVSLSLTSNACLEVVHPSKEVKEIMGDLNYTSKDVKAATIQLSVR